MCYLAIYPSLRSFITPFKSNRHSIDLLRYSGEPFPLMKIRLEVQYKGRHIQSI
jgi:hypothetical protein